MGRPWRVVGADASGVGAGGSGGGCRRLSDLAVHGAPSLGPGVSRVLPSDPCGQSWFGPLEPQRFPEVSKGSWWLKSEVF